jgi:DNA-binding beta-propeller fold protein YncE
MVRGLMKHALSLLMFLGLVSVAQADGTLSPVDVDWNPAGTRLFITAETGRQILVLDTTASNIVRRIALPARPTASVLSRDGRTLYVTGGGAAGKVFVVDAERGTIRQTLDAGHTPGAPTLSPDGKTLMVCNQFNHDVSFINLENGETTARVPVAREPVAADLTPDGKTLFVANLLPDGPANRDTVACKVSAIDTRTKTVTSIPLANGAEGVRGLRVSPDGKHVFLTSIMARFLVPTTQLQRGWVATHALSVIRVADLTLQNTILLDDVDRGFPNPWAIAFSGDGETLVISAAGTHEISLIDLPAMMRKMAAVQADSPATAAEAIYNDLSFISGIRERVALNGLGPRAIAVKDKTVYVAHTFSDSIDCVPLEQAGKRSVRSMELNPGMVMTPARQGEIFFNDATACFQNWLSCATCHPDARTDGMNWDLLNDGVGNPKNVKSMLLAFQTPPTTWLAARENATVSVRSGFRHIEYAIRPEADSTAVDAYLQSLKPEPSPYLVQGKLSPAGERGKKRFEEQGCTSCHPAPLFTDRQAYDLGTTTGLDVGRPVDTPSLVEAWRTGPYMHDGRAATIMDVLKKAGHGRILSKTADLKDDQLRDLATYILSIPEGAQ